MNSLFFQLIAIANSLLLTLPAGYCGSLHAEAAESAPVPAACCQNNVQRVPCDSQHTPVHPRLECCCSWDATLPKKLTQPDNHTASFALAVLVTDLTADPASMGKVVVATVLPSDRSLHVLQCVWLC